MLGVATRRISVDDYHRMGEAGIFRPGERVELLDGEIIPMSPIGWRHMLFVLRWNRVLGRLLQDQVWVSPQGPVTLDDYSESEPDIALLRGSYGEADGRLPNPQDTLIVIEVSDSSLAIDRDIKLPRYARAGIPQAIITDLVQNCIESHTNPGPDGYATVQVLLSGDQLELVGFPGLTVPVADLFPPV